MLRIAFDKMVSEFERVLESRGLTQQYAHEAALVFAQNSCDGVYSHGLNRFPRVIEYLDKGAIDPTAKPECVSAFGAMERWNGHRGVGPLNASLAMGRACELADSFGIGMVAIGNTNHWMRGGTYGWQACDKGKIAICWSLATANMPAWGGMDNRLGNNPIVFAVPRSNGEHVVVDLALSQFSYGKLEDMKLKGQKLPVYGGYDSKGCLTDDPAEIEATQRVLPMGYWKGSGMSVLLEMIATVLTNGFSVQEISRFEEETGISQVMIAIDPSKFNSAADTDKIVDELTAFVNSSVPADPEKPVLYPGERVINIRRENLEKGVPVVEEKWNQVLAL